jgi:hypothetical protein
MEEFYYSFKTGYYTDFQSKWILHDIKIPAYNVREAVIIFMLHRETQMKLSNQWLARKKEFIFPTAGSVHLIIRQAIEYRISKKRGFFLVQYKKVRVITSHEILTYFKH